MALCRCWLCSKAGAAPEASRMDRGRGRRRAAASRPPFSGGLHGVGVREPLPGTASAGVMPRPN
jgi:hypothetical protein